MPFYNFCNTMSIVTDFLRQCEEARKQALQAVPQFCQSILGGRDVQLLADLQHGQLAHRLLILWSGPIPGPARRARHFLHLAKAALFAGAPVSAGRDNWCGLSSRHNRISDRACRASTECLCGKAAPEAPWCR